MSHSKKTHKSATTIPNYSKYDFINMMPNFMQTDRVLENDLHELKCYSDYELEAPLNHFSDSMLNNHLYTMYKKGKLETPELMWKLLCFFMKHYRKILEPRVTEYLHAKKLTLDDWLNAIKSNRRGDIVCVFFLSMVTGNHTAIHLKNDKVWSTLKMVPLLYDNLVERCEIHLVYMGFGIFLWLKKWQIANPELPLILGTITSDNLEVWSQLHVLIKTENTDTDEQPPKRQITAAAGSSSQLLCVEGELEQDTAACNTGTIHRSKQLPKSKIRLLVKDPFFTVNLVRLSEATIHRYTKWPAHTCTAHSGIL